MKRGLVTPPAPGHEQRLQALRERMGEAGAEVALIYGDVSRSDDIAHLTNLCIYWNEGVLGVRADGEPALLSKLSKRVHPWMRATSTLRDLRSGRDLAALIAEFAEGAGRVGIVDRDLWPAPLLGRLAAACPGTELVDLPDAVREDRIVPAPGAVEALRALGAELGAALDAAIARGDGEAQAEVERRLRGAGALDVVAWRDVGPDGAVTLDVTVQRRGLWLRAARCTGGPAAERAGAALAAAAAALRAGVRPAQPAGASVRLTSHADLATGGALRADAPPREGEVVVLAAEVERAVAADAFLISAGGAEPLSRSEADAALG